jgi:Zn-dependent peptidase ImmA (M78 family)/transcriptional regulator with XRE-family HTH domain
MHRVPNPEMLLLARQSRGIKQGELAEIIGVSSGYLSKVERGISTPTPELLASIAAELHYPVSLFFRPEHVRGTDSVCFHHRKQKTMPAPLLDQIESEMFLTQLQVASVLRDLEIESSNSFMTLDIEDYEDDPRMVARMVRRLWKVPPGPIRNLVRLIESAGAVVVFRDFGTPKLDGMSCWPKGCPPLFFINRRLPMDRARFTLAHELGHLVMHATPPAGNPETEAHEFASEFLMPAIEIGPDLRDLRIGRLPSLKAHWGTSMQSIIQAAASLGFATPSRVKSLYVQLSRQGFRTNEPYSPPPEEPTILGDALRVHRIDHRYDIDDLARLVDLYSDEFRELYEPEESGGLRLLA